MKLKSYQLIKWNIWLMFFTCSMVVIQFSGRTLFLFLQLALCISMVLLEKKLYLNPHLLINAVMITVVCSTISSCFSDIPFSYKKAAVFIAVYEIIAYFSQNYLHTLMGENKKLLAVMIHALKLMVIVQVIWVSAQYVLYHFGRIDLNQIIFVDFLHLMENASFIRNWRYHPSGLTWHSAVLAPMFVIAFALFDDPWLRCLILVDAMICGNSTALIGTVLCAVMLFVAWSIRLYHHRTIEIRIVVTWFLIVVCAVLGMVYFDLFDKFLGVFINIWNRLFSEARDPSASAHFSYYSDYLTVLNNMSVPQFLFGYGLGCSGWTITEMYDRYTTLGNWAVECDIVNILLSRGFLGFIVYYAFLFTIAWKGRKLNVKYAIVMAAIIIQGFGYNVQWEFVFMIEVILLYTIRWNIDFFDFQTNT